jgi:hypothetical protein
MLDQCFSDVRLFQVWIFRQQFALSGSSGELPENHPDCYPHATDAGFPAHNIRVPCYSRKLLHGPKYTLFLETQSSTRRGDQAENQAALRFHRI